MGSERKVRTPSKQGTFEAIGNGGGGNLMESATENNRPSFQAKRKSFDTVKMTGKGENVR